MTSSEDAAAQSLDAAALSELADRVGVAVQGDHDGRGLRIGLACGLFNGTITRRLLDGAVDALVECGVDRGDLVLAWAPGAFELPLVGAGLLGGGVDAVVCLGAVIRGETGHYDLVAGECASGIQRVQLATGRPVIFGVLTTESLDQALARSAPGPVNKGREAALAAVEMVRLLRSGALGPAGLPGAGGSPAVVGPRPSAIL